MKILLWIVALAIMFVAGFYSASRDGFQVPPLTFGSSKQQSGDQQPTIIQYPAATAMSADEPKGMLTLEQILAKERVFELLLAAHQSVALMTPEQTQQFILQVAADKEVGTLRVNLLQIGIRRLTAIDAPSTLAFVKANESIPNDWMLGIVITNWLYYAPEEVVDYVTNLAPTDPWREFFANRLVGEQQLERAGLAHRLDDMVGGSAELLRYHKSIAGASREQAFELAMLITDDTLRREQGRHAIRRWASQDPLKAFSRVQMISDAALKQMYINEVSPYLAAQEPAAALVFLEENLDDPELIRSMLWNLAEQAPENVLPLAQSLDDASTLRRVLVNLAKQNPLQAIAYIDTSNMAPSEQLQNYSQVYNVFLQQDPVGAIDWVISRFDDNPQVAGSALQRGFTEQSYGAALSAYERSQHPGVRANLLQGMAIYKTSHGHSGVIDWLQQYEGQPGYENALVGVMQNTHGQMAGDLIESIEPYLDNHLVASQLGQLARKWHRQDPDALQNWLADLSYPAAKDSVLTTLARKTPMQDLDAAARYIEQIETPYMKEDAALSLAYQFIQIGTDVDQVVATLNLTGNAEAKIRASARVSAAMRPVE